MAAEDFAVIVGISHYPDPGVGSLQGSDLDADEFRQWLQDPKGGDVPPANIRFINSLAVKDGGVPAWKTRPLEHDVTGWFDELQGIAQGKPGKRMGRRLYIYFAGHGVVSKWAFAPLMNDAALLMANASPTNSPHIFGRIYAAYFMKAGIFDEVALFMDTCRDVVPTLVPRMLTYADRTVLTSNPIDRGYYVFATEWSKMTREKQIDGQVRGVFTKALLDGLRGAASDANGAVTTTSLREYLLAKVTSVYTAEELAADPNIKPPQIDGDHRMVFAQYPPPQFQVKVTVAATLVGRQLRVRNAKLKIVLDLAIASVEVTVTLGKGDHLFEVVTGAQAPTEALVTVEGDCHVQLA